MKETPLELEYTEPGPAAEPTKAAPNYVTVYTFVIWDHDRRSTVTYPRMATPAAIARMRGKINEETAWVVEESGLDIEGFYSGGDPTVR